MFACASHGSDRLRKRGAGQERRSKKSKSSRRPRQRRELVPLPLRSFTPHPRRSKRKLPREGSSWRSARSRCACVQMVEAWRAD